MADERNDGSFVIHMTDKKIDDLKCDIYSTEPNEADIQSLFEQNRYVTSIVHSKFGTIVTHKNNTDGIRQFFAIIAPWDLKKESKKKLKEGFTLSYYNNLRHYALYDFRTNISKQEFFEKLDQKKLAKKNKDGLYVTTYASYAAYAQNGHNDVTEQKYATYMGYSELIKGFKKMAAESWVVGSVSKSYNKYGDWTYYYVIYDKYRDGLGARQSLGALDTEKELSDYLAQRLKDGYTINRIYCGWENRDYAAEEARANAANYNVFDILSGIMNSVSGITGTGSTQASGTTDSNISTSKRSASNTKASNHKCRQCNGSGTCSPVSGSGRKNACHGSGLCGYCNGTGWNKAGSSEAKCSACNGTGKCKKCKGSGKCPACHGSGK
ncbi:MAG: hypothetical protein K2H17_08805 [Duncaniella sp.]|uniref:hypothetical protein n=1 Tax=Duncaniella sp. TaxID=2518496 RepID=UPI0023CB93EA|nr:hypothetical protein [Duncaniella sp.]MDE5989484.1 hypothetical protein [Duncaniella sp.]